MMKLYKHLIRQTEKFKNVWPNQRQEMDEEIIQIVEPTKEILEKADFYINLVEKILPTADVALIGSLAIPVCVKNEMDILVEIDPDQDILATQEKIRDESEGVFNMGVIGGSEGFSRSKRKFGIRCELHFLHKGSEKAKKYLDLLMAFKADPELTSRYDQFKRSLNGVTETVYREEKKKFMEENGLSQYYN